MRETEMPPSAAEKPRRQTRYVWRDDDQRAPRAQRSSAVGQQGYRIRDVLDDIDQIYQIELAPVQHGMRERTLKQVHAMGLPGHLNDRLARFHTDGIEAEAAGFRH